jgi:hypothetical protein
MLKIYNIVDDDIKSKINNYSMFINENKQQSYKPNIYQDLVRAVYTNKLLFYLKINKLIPNKTCLMILIKYPYNEFSEYVFKQGIIIMDKKETRLAYML